MAVDEAEINRRCEELRDLIAFEPGLNPDALDQGHRLIEKFSSMRSDAQINEHLFGLTYGFEKWFSDGAWSKRKSEREVVRSNLHSDLVRFRVAMAVGRDLQGKGHRE
jgi:hypothetical protein